MIRVCYTGNSAMFDGFLISLLSMSEHTKEPLDISILTADFSYVKPKFVPFTEKQGVFLERMLRERQPDSRVHVYRVDDLFSASMKDSPNLSSDYSPYIFLRLLMEEIHELGDRIIYLDADTIVMGDIAELYRLDLKGKDIGMAADYLGRVFIYPGYSNDGVFLVDLAKVRVDGVFAQAREICRTVLMDFPDQDALNRAIRGKRKIISSRYNEQRRLRKNTVIRHYTQQLRIFPWPHPINVKPWDIERLHNIYRVHDHDELLAEYLAYKQKYDKEQ
jgi:lipopolysaccharide biosynthesis glycosyltransferase